MKLFKLGVGTAAQGERSDDRLPGGTNPGRAPSPDIAACRDRAIGALVGLAVGDAVGTTLEFAPKPDTARLFDMVGGGPFHLEPGEWTDDTAMALALADSLLAAEPFDPVDLMTRFVDWHDNGTYSCTGSCFDIGVTVAGALGRFVKTGDPYSGSTGKMTAGNGALMRLAPVALRYWADGQTLRRVAALQTKTTHGAAEAILASEAFAALLALAIAGEPLSAILRASETFDGLLPWRGLKRDAIHGSGYVMQSLQAALWAVSQTSDFRAAILLAANLGEDADTTAAIAGQLAGSVYGLAGIPEDWLQRLAWRERIVSTAAALFDRGQAAEPAP